MPSPPSGASHLNLTLGGLVTLGGLMGYMKRKSVMSAVAGGAVGAVYFGSAYMINNTDKVKEGFCVGTAASSLLLGAMVPRMIKARAVNPVGAACTVIGLVGVAYNGYQYRQWS